MDQFGPASTTRLPVDVYTAAYRVSGLIVSRFQRVADVLNLLGSTHLVVEEATIVELARPKRVSRFPVVHVAMGEILVLASDREPDSRPEMRIEKRAVRAEVAMPPLRLAGAIHVPHGGRAIDGFLNAGDRFLPMTDVAVRCASGPGLDRQAAAVAVQRDRAHLVMVAEDERPDQLLAEVLDEQTAQEWLTPEREPIG